MNTGEIARALTALLSELVDGSPDPAKATYMLNRGDAGLLQSLENVSATAASSSATGGASIAAHVEHLRYGLNLLNRWASGAPEPWKNADWRQAWQRQIVTDAAWRTLRDELRRETHAWMDAMRAPREVQWPEFKWMVGSIPHLAYHLGAIRQIERASRGPTAEDERRAEDALRATIARPPASG